MRVIIRFSLNNDRGSGLRNTLKPILESYGIMWTGARTGTYEGIGISEKDIRWALAKFWRAAVAAKATVHIDHFWMYSDKKMKKKSTVKAAKKKKRPKQLPDDLRNLFE